LQKPISNSLQTLVTVLPTEITKYKHISRQNRTLSCLIGCNQLILPIKYDSRYNCFDFIHYVWFSFLRYSTSNNGMQLKSGLGVIRGHWKWLHFIRWNLH